jgi:large subunit ribosomal protein L4e
MTMNLKIVTAENVEKGTIKTPAQFDEPVRADLIHRAVEAQQTHERQAYGSDVMAGKRQTAWLRHRRRVYKGAYGHGIARVGRKIMSRNGSQMHWVGAFAPSTVGGMRAHPPKAMKIITKAINIKERKKALRSALAATVDKNVVAKRGHKAPAAYPFVLDSSIEAMSKTSDILKALEKLNLKDELARSAQRSIRAGKGKNRARPYQKRIGPLIVVSKTCPVIKAAANIPGVQAVAVDRLNAVLLAPGGHAGRLTLYTDAALQRMEKEGLFQ